MWQISFFLLFISLCIFAGYLRLAWKKHAFAAVLLTVLVMTVLTKTNTAQAASPSAPAFAGSIRETTLEKQIEEYYQAISDLDAGRAKKALGISDSLSVTHQFILRENGLERYADLQPVIYPAGKDRLVFLSYALVIENSDTKLPGLTTLIAQKKEEDGWILLYPEDQDMLSPKERERFRERAAALGQDDDVTDLIADVDAAYAEAIAKEPGLQDWAETCRLILWEAAAASQASYIVQEGDCLWSIAQHTLGNGCLWRDLYAQNKTRIGANPDLIFPGTKLRLPSR